MSRIKAFLVTCLTFPLSPCKAMAVTYTPLITETTFDGVKADVSTTAISIISILLIIIAVALIARAMTH